MDETGPSKDSTPAPKNIGKIALALSKAQAKIMGASKDGNNPHFNSSFATLASVMDAIREPLSENELSLIQPTCLVGENLYIKTIIMHSSGESLEGIYPVICKDWNNPQAVGSGMSYSRRYSVTAMLCIPQLDDDGNGATGPSQSNHQPESKISGDPAEYEIKMGTHKGKRLKEFTLEQLHKLAKYYVDAAAKQNKDVTGPAREFLDNLNAYVDYLDAVSAKE